MRNAGDRTTYWVSTRTVMIAVTVDGYGCILEIWPPWDDWLGRSLGELLRQPGMEDPILFELHSE